MLFITSISIYAQPPGMLNPYSVCDDGINDGYTTFNLTATDPIGSLGLNPAVYTVAFYPSVADANNNVNVIANPSAYINEVAYSQTIGVRFLNSSTSEVAVSGMALTIVPLVVPMFGPQSAVCYGDFSPPLPTISLNGISGSWSPPMSDVTTVYTFTPNAGQCAASATMIVTVYPAPTANPGTLYFCDPMELAIYNLSDANAQITAGAAGFIGYLS